MDKREEKSYFNTMLFTILAAILSIVLLVLLILGFLKDYTYFVIGVEAGILLIVIYCIYKIIKCSWESKKKVAKIYFNTCPDFYTKKVDSNGEPYCVNQHTVTDIYNNQSIMKTYPASQSLPSTLDNTPPILGAQNKHEKFYLNELENAVDLPTTGDKCQTLFSNSSNPAYSGYNIVPWTRVKSQCATFLEDN